MAVKNIYGVKEIERVEKRSCGLFYLKDSHVVLKNTLYQCIIIIHWVEHAFLSDLIHLRFE